MFTGLLVLDKPEGPTSHDVVDEVRRVLRQKRVGHTGTLDPMATGVLVLCLGQATRLSEYLVGEEKSYRGTIRLGEATDTYDATGQVTGQSDMCCTIETVEEALSSFRGKTGQRPPIYSALKKDGQRAYQRARKGETVELEERPIEIFSLGLLDYTPPDVTIELRCSSGTYVRSLAHDLGEKLGGHGHLASLRRLSCGVFTTEDSVSMDRLERAVHGEDLENLIVAPDVGLSHWPSVQLDGESIHAIRHGQSIPATGTALAKSENPNLLGKAGDGRLVAVLRHDRDQDVLRPVKVFSA